MRVRVSGAVVPTIAPMIVLDGSNELSKGYLELEGPEEAFEMFEFEGFDKVLVVKPEMVTATYYEPI